VRHFFKNTGAVSTRASSSVTATGLIHRTKHQKHPSSWIWHIRCGWRDDHAEIEDAVMWHRTFAIFSIPIFTKPCITILSDQFFTAL